MKEIVITAKDNGLRAALFEDSELMEVFEEEGLTSRAIGNIYRGRVENILPGMQAAFVNIGLDKNSFLYVGDAISPVFEGEEKVQSDHAVRIEEVLRPRQELLVQVIKEPVGSKGARITTNITLPGRYVVLMPKVDYVGVSRKILDSEERSRLKELALQGRPEGMGVIVRTLAEGVSGEEISSDIRHLVGLWSKIDQKVSKVSIPGLVHRDLDLISRLVRDLIDNDVQRITVDKQEIADFLREELKEIAHPAARQVVVDLRDNLFERYEVDYEIHKFLRPKVWLKSGGYLIIQQTEALTIIDVNTGKYTGNHSLKETVYRTNLEAAGEIARQLRVRNIGGIIIIDFIDMLDQEDRQGVVNALVQACSRDKTKCQVLGLTQLGLVEMTRKKVGQTLATRYKKVCPTCEGKGFIDR
ncbi:MAG: Rne/Rng family ribonuclease [Desulfitobacterium hafniense]|nr:Rne/Rng family ribonuclease [Desulfitobacterium hafniense]